MKAPVPEPTQKPSETLQALEASAGARTTSARGLAFVTTTAASRIRVERLANVVAAE